jgi:hypothetical protein
MKDKKLLLELDRLIKEHHEIKKLIISAQTCCLIEGIKISDITERLTRQVLNKVQLSPELCAQLGTILKQLVENLASQKTSFFYQLASYLINKNLDRLDKNSWDQNLRKFLNQHLKALNLQKNSIQIKIENPEQKEIYLTAEREVAEHVAAYKTYRTLFKFALIYCVMLGLVNIGDSENLYFHLRNVFLAVFSAFMYLYGSHRLTQFTLSLMRDDLQKQASPTWELEKIKFINPVSLKSTGIGYLPKVPTEEGKLQSVIDSSLTYFKNSQEEKELSTHQPLLKIKVKRKGHIIDHDHRYESPPQAMLASLSWPGSTVLFGDPNSVIPERKLHPIESTQLPKHIHILGYFNSKALEEQTGKKSGLIRGADKWKFLKSQVRDGHSVSPHYTTGIKRLVPPVKFNVRIGHKPCGEQLFRWSVKNTVTQDRLLGRQQENTIQKDAKGNIYLLVDFCYYLPKGPGH